MLEPVHIGIRVSDIERSVAFYTKVFNAKAVKRTQTPNALCTFMRVGEMLIELVKREGDTPLPSEQCHIAFVTDNIFKEVETLKEKGLVFAENSYPFSKDIPKQIGENSYIFFFRGPDGELFEICQNAGTAS